MGQETLIIIIILFLIAMTILGGIYFLYFAANKRENRFDSLLKTNRGENRQYDTSSNQFDDIDKNSEEYKEFERRKKELRSKRKKLTDEERYYHAGYITVEDQERIKKVRIYLPVVLALIGAVIGLSIVGPRGILFGVTIGGIFGYIAPSFYIDVKTKKRQQEIMYYLPLVIEQIAIGVSSSLDLGPCIAHIIKMSDERDSHNVVTELLYHAERYINSGVNFQDALTEVGIKSGHTELKHTFMALAQVAKHGGEISHQLHELALTVSAQRETQIQAKIKQLELKATGPVALVFVGFLVLLLTGIMINAKGIF